MGRLGGLRASLVFGVGILVAVGSARGLCTVFTEVLSVYGRLADGLTTWREGGRVQGAGTSALLLCLCYCSWVLGVGSC